MSSFRSLLRLVIPRRILVDVNKLGHRTAHKGTMPSMGKKQGKIIITADINVWPHEIETAKALAAAGFVVEFIRKSSDEYATSADVRIDGVIWEMKSPKASNIKAVERNVKRARWQSPNIIFDSRRMKGIPDKAIERELRKHAFEISGVKHLVFVNRHAFVIDIK